MASCFGLLCILHWIFKLSRSCYWHVGRLCEDRILSDEPCTGVTCENGGTCVGLTGGLFYCSCLPSFVGEMCQLGRMTTATVYLLITCHATKWAWQVCFDVGNGARCMVSFRCPVSVCLKILNSFNISGVDKPTLFKFGTWIEYGRGHSGVKNFSWIKRCLDHVTLFKIFNNFPYFRNVWSYTV